MIRCLHFKTSYEVYPEPPVSINMNYINFKTSYVEVYHDINEEKLSIVYFKTSYVEVYPTGEAAAEFVSAFQNILSVEVYHLRKQEA